MSIIGANVQVTPPAAASAAATRPAVSATAGSKLAAWASGIGKVVSWPWMTSRPMSSGMPCGVSSTATRCSSFVASALRGQKTAPMPPRTSSAASSSRGR